MAKRAISVTLSPESLIWLKAKTLERGAKSISDTLDKLVFEARGKERVRMSVVGTARIAEDDPLLESANDALKQLFSFRGKASGVRRRRGR